MSDEKVDELGQRPLTTDDYFAGGELYVAVDSTRWNFQLYVRQANHPRTMYREATGIQWAEPRAFGPDTIEPCPILMTLHHKEAQQLMDDLWRAGLRPNDIVVDDKGTIAAQEANLTDLRKIIFDHPLFTPSIVRELRSTDAK